MTLLICPVRPGDDNEELRHALRSWDQHLILPDGLVLLTVGHRPDWLDPDEHIEGNAYGMGNHSIWDNIRLASEHAAQFMVKDAIYMNDDFFCMEPVGSVLPVRRNISLAEHIAMYPQYQSMWWVRSLVLTASWLSEAGFPHPASYEVHRPLPASPRAMSEALAQWDGGIEGDLPQWRTLYGVLNHVQAYPVADVKLGARPPNPFSPWISTSDISWRKYGRDIVTRFQKPSRWER